MQLKEKLTISPDLGDLGGSAISNGDSDESLTHKTSGNEAGGGIKEPGQKSGTVGNTGSLSEEAGTEQANVGTEKSGTNKLSGTNTITGKSVGKSTGQQSQSSMKSDAKNSTDMLSGEKSEIKPNNNTTSNGAAEAMDKQASEKDTTSQSAAGNASGAEAGEESESANEEAGDLAKPEPQQRSFVPVYDAKTGKYLLYDEENLLSAKNEHLAPINEQQLKTAAVKLENQMNSQKLKTAGDNGIFPLSLIAASIVVLLFYIYNRKRGI
jgi:hypothetical protein